MPMTSGSTPATPQPTSRPIGRSPRSAGEGLVGHTSAAAPSQMPEALPAVTTPSFRKYGASLASTSGVVSGRMCSSAAQATSFRVFRSLTVTGDDLFAAIAPDAQAAPAPAWLRAA